MREPIKRTNLRVSGDGAFIVLITFANNNVTIEIHYLMTQVDDSHFLFLQCSFLIPSVVLLYSEPASRALGGDEREGDGSEEPARGPPGRQPAVRFQASRGRGLALANGGLVGEDEAGRDDRRRPRNADKGTKGKKVNSQRNRNHDHCCSFGRMNKNIIFRFKLFVVNRG